MAQWLTRVGYSLCLLPLMAIGNTFNLEIENNTEYQLIAPQGTSEAFCDASIPGVLPPGWANPILGLSKVSASSTLLPVPSGFTDDMQCTVTTEFNPQVLIRFSVAYFNSGSQKNELCVKTLGCNRLILSYSKDGDNYSVGIHTTERSQSCIPTTKPYCLPTV